MILHTYENMNDIEYKRLVKSVDGPPRHPNGFEWWGQRAKCTRREHKSVAPRLIEHILVSGDVQQTNALQGALSPFKTTVAAILAEIDTERKKRGEVAW